MTTEELQGIPGDPELIEEAFRQMEEHELSDGMLVHVPPASRSSQMTRMPLSEVVARRRPARYTES
eukprot:8769809-Pyramimonas_sp.AAC.2